VSERRACLLVSQHRSTNRHQPDAGVFERRLVARLHELANDHPQEGYKTIHRRLRWEGWRVNHKRIERLWRRAREVYRAYRSGGGPGTVRTRSHFSMTIAQLGHIAEMACRIWLDPTTPEDERRRQEARVAESIDQPLTVAVIDELLDAVGTVT
jgi:hypothetical protein